jgi:2-oxoisovalerate dehydrogenase E2 component (dihydrolipoyl transacylase)
MLVIALERHPVLNATWLEAEGGRRIQVHRGVRLGIAVATERARAGALAPAELGESTFTVSNFGALGLDEGVPVINYPEAAILGMGSLKPRAVVLDDVVVARPTMTLTCAFDHRIADGAQAAAFLTELRGLIEEPETALLEL